MSAREIFKELGFEYEYKKGTNNEDLIQYHKDNIHIQFNLISNIIVFTDDTSEVYYGKNLFMMNPALLQAINMQCEEMGWNE